jgi:UDP:flavonoid glycosyltransferase YjiC (YdhE family)
LAALERLGFAIRVPKSQNPSAKIQVAIERLLSDDVAKAKAAAFARIVAQWDGPRIAAEMLVERYGSRE